MGQHLDPYLKGVEKENKKVTPATFKRGLIVAVHNSSWSADVIVVGNNQTILKNIPLSSAINPNAIQAGDRCRIDMFDEVNQGDMVVAYTYGRKPSSLVHSGIYSAGITGSGTGVAVSIPHGLGQVPTMVSVSSYALIGDLPGAGVYTGGTILESIDAVNLNVRIWTGTNTSIRTVPIYWFAGIL